MKTYCVYFTDYPWQAMKVKARNITEARSAGRLYIRQWGLDVDIDRIEEEKEA